MPTGYTPEVGTLNYLMLELLGIGIQLEICWLHPLNALGRDNLDETEIRDTMSALS